MPHTLTCSDLAHLGEAACLLVSPLDHDGIERGQDLRCGGHPAREAPPT